jgi:hypothetical protein
MSLLSRSWQCLNRACGKEFHSYEHGNPPCPSCGCVRVNWTPGGGHIANMAPRADRTLRELADAYGMTNMNSPSHSRVNRAMPRLEQPRADTQPVHFAPGFSAPMSLRGATCVPSTAPVNLRGSVRVGMPFDHSATIPGPGANAVVVARHREGK